MLQNDTNSKLHRSIKVYGLTSYPNDDLDYQFGTIEAVHEAVHEGKVHTISYTKLAVANNGTLIIRIKANSKDVHARFAWLTEGKSTIKTYVGTTFSANGTVYTPFNRRTSLSNSLVSNTYIDPTVNVLGTQRGDDFIGAGGATPERVGGTGSTDVETIIDKNTEWMMVITNLRGSASDINFIANIYER